MKFKPTQSNIFYLTALMVLFIAATSFTGWISGIYDGSMATLSNS